MSEACDASPDAQPISKNQLKKQRRNEQWEAGREARKVKRKEKVKEKKQKLRASREEILSDNQNRVPKANDMHRARPRSNHRPRHAVQVPVTFVIDCGFDELMHEGERKSLAGQVTRCYADNTRAMYQAHIAISSFGGHMKERFEGLLEGRHSSWKNVQFRNEDFAHVANEAHTWMNVPGQSDIQGALRPLVAVGDAPDLYSAPRGEIVYLTSDSTETLTELKPFSTYIIGGIVDRNRHKGLCYKRAVERGIKTARLPIGEYMQMTSRAVLATNHVSEIMLKWLEVGNWGQAFLHVMPKRKGGTLRESSVPIEESCHDKVEQDQELNENGHALDGAKDVNRGKDPIHDRASPSTDLSPAKPAEVESYYAIDNDTSSKGPTETQNTTNP